MAQKNNKLQEIIAEQAGRVPPQAVDIEEAVLGSLMILDDVEYDYAAQLKPDVFYKEAHQKIYRAIANLIQQNKKVDLFTVKEQLLSTGELEEIGGAAYLARLTYNVGSAAHLDYHIKILIQKYIQRELIKIATDLQNRAYDAATDVDELLDHAESQLFNLAYGSISSEAKPLKDILPGLLAELEEISQKQEALTGVPSGYPTLDRITGGWQRSDLIIIAARPSMGKTAFVVNLARNLAVDNEQAVAFFTLEMPSSQIAMRLLSIESQISSNKIRTGQLDSDEWLLIEEKLGKLMSAPIIIDDTPQLSIFELRAKARRLKSKYDIKLLIIDYLQLMSLPSEGKMNREQVVSQISRGLKAIAKELNIPVIALSQLNRAVELRGGNKRPQLSDLRESGAIEQDADLVIFLHRPEYYGIKEDEEQSYEGIAEIIIAKHRNGPVADLKLRYIKEYGKFEENESQILQDLDETYDKQDTIIQRLGSKMNSQDDFSDDLLGPAQGNNLNSSMGDDDIINTDFDSDEIPY